MDAATLSIIGLLLANITGAAYSYGRLTQKVDDLIRRVRKLERANGCSDEGAQ